MAKKTPEKKQSYQIHEVDIESVHLNPKNPRVILDDDFIKLVNSVKNDGFMLAIRFLVVDKNNFVLGGNQRLKACRVAGRKTVFIVKAEDLNEDQLKTFVVKDNTYFGEWDKQMLANVYSDTELIDFGLKLIDVSVPRMETIGDIQPEIDQSILDKKKQTYDNNETMQIVTYFPLEIYDKVISSIDSIKSHMNCEENTEVLLRLISYWKANFAS